MTILELDNRFSIMNRFFQQGKWKDKEGGFRYPKGRKAFDALRECLSIMFAEDEMEVVTEFTVKEANGLSGCGLLCEAKTDTEKRYCSFFLAEKVFVYNVLDPSYVDVFGEIFRKSKREVKTEEKTAPVVPEETKELFSEEYVEDFTQPEESAPKEENVEQEESDAEPDFEFNEKDFSDLEEAIEGSGFSMEPKDMVEDEEDDFYGAKIEGDEDLPFI